MREDIMTTYKELKAIKESFDRIEHTPTKKLYWVATDPVTGIMKLSCDFRDIMGHGLDNVHEVWAHNSEAARLEYNALR